MDLRNPSLVFLLPHRNERDKRKHEDSEERVPDNGIVAVFPRLLYRDDSPTYQRDCRDQCINQYRSPYLPRLSYLLGF